MKQGTKLALEKPDSGKVPLRRARTVPMERQVFPTLIRIFEYPGAHEAFDKLLECNVKQRLIGHQLYEIGVAPDRNVKPPWPDRRLGASLIRRATKLADDIEKPSRLPALYFGNEVCQKSVTVKALRAYANWLTTQLNPSFMIRCRPLSPRTSAIMGLLNIVKDSSSDARYKEVATLLNATDVAYGRGKNEPQWNEVNLAQMRYRWRCWMKQFDLPFIVNPL